MSPCPIRISLKTDQPYEMNEKVRRILQQKCKREKDFYDEHWKCL